MPRRSKHTHVHVHTLRWDCDLHGGHIVIVAGLDQVALASARQIERQSRADDWPCTMSSLAIPIDEARRAAGGEEISIDDLPF